ncbi:MAG: flavin-dependent oxidoreductase [Pseudomonadota bacterium]
MSVLIAGGGIAGLALGLTCHQIGVPFKIFESARYVRPLGVGINLQPAAVRELHDLGLADALASIGVETRDYGMHARFGQDVWTEPRGRFAGYHWPQYSVHRGALLMLLYETLIDRAGTTCIEPGWRATGFESQSGGATLHLESASEGQRAETGDIVIGADGIHSAIRAQIAPDEGPPIWGGNILWRGTTRAKPFKSGASMVLIGYPGLRFVSYPITPPHPKTGEATVNWICNLKMSEGAAFRKEDWTRAADLADFLPHYASFDLDWIDIPGLITGADEVLEYPLVDRDPLPCWRSSKVSLMGDAAHAAYPSGSNGAGAAILDARTLGAALVQHGCTEAALHVYEAEMRPMTSAVTLANRAAGPDAILDEVDRRSGGRFERVQEVMSAEELQAHAEDYKMMAGTSVRQTNQKPPIIPPEAQQI